MVPALHALSLARLGPSDTTDQRPEAVQATIRIATTDVDGILQEIYDHNVEQWSARRSDGTRPYQRCETLDLSETTVCSTVSKCRAIDSGEKLALANASACSPLRRRSSGSRSAAVR